MKTRYLARYDYGTGGAWIYLTADSAAQIRERFPQLRVVTDGPGWLTDDKDRLGGAQASVLAQTEQIARGKLSA